MGLINVSELLTDPDFIQVLNGTRVTTQIATTGDEAGEAMVATSPLSFTGAAMPLRSQKDIELLPEGYRNSDGVVIYTNFELFASSGDDGTAGAGPAVVDLVTYKGKPNKIVVCERWDEYGYYKAIGVVQP